MKIAEIIAVIENAAPLVLQESYDNSGLIIGSPDTEVNSALITLDVTDAVIDEALKYQCNLIIAHHPLIFKSIKKIGTKYPVERMITRCIKNDLAVYAAHTNLDNVAQGVNKMICDKIGLENVTVLAPKSMMLRKLVTFCPVSYAEMVRKALFDAGAGHIGNYDNCSFNAEGRGTFRALAGSSPFIGKIDELHTEPEIRIETIFPVYRQSSVLDALFGVHPYEEVAYDIYPLENDFFAVGAGMTGNLKNSEPTMDFLHRIKKVFGIPCLRHTKIIRQSVQKIAVCGGTGSFLLSGAMAEKADVYITGDIKYHEFFDADEKILFVDIGHYESEQFTTDVIRNILSEKIPTFATRISKIRTNPVFYL